MSKLVAIVAVLVACSSSKEEAPPSPSSTPTAPPPTARAPKPPPQPQAPRDLGACVIRATGAATFEQKTDGGRSAINVWHWVDEDQRDLVAAFILNCAGADARISFTAKKQAVEALPAFGPKQYTFGDGPEALAVMGTVRGELFTHISGTLDITTFDAERIAGDFKLTGKLKDQPATLEGRFDYPCPGYARCAK